MRWIMRQKMTSYNCIITDKEIDAIESMSDFLENHWEFISDIISDEESENVQRADLHLFNWIKEVKEFSPRK